MPPPTDLRLSRLAYAAFAERVQAETGDGRTPTPKLLDDCGTLTGTADPEVVTFIQILPLVASRLGKPSRPLVPPTGLLQLVRDGGKSVQVFQSSAARLTAAATGAQSPEAPDVRRPPAAIRPYARPSPLGSLLTDLERPAALTPLGVGDAADVGLAFGGLRVGRRPSAGFPAMLLPAPLRREVALPIPLLPTWLRPGPAVFEAVWDGLNQLSQLHLATHPSSNPHWAVAVDYEQVWNRVAYRRGRLLGSIPLTPSESAEIVVKTWERRSERRKTVEAIEENTSTEVVGDEHWSAATAKEIARTSASTIDVSAGIDGGVTLPVQGSPVSIGGNLGFHASFAEQLSRRTQCTAERTQQLTVKTVSGLKSTRTQPIELAHETGTETTATQRLTNPNPCGTLTYHFFEVVEEYVVTTRPVRATPLLLVP